MPLRKLDETGSFSMHRRRFLKTAGGLALALPVMESLVGAKAAHAASTADRLVVAVHRQGTLNSLWEPPAVGNLTLSPLLQPLAAVKEKLLVISGIENRIQNSLMEDGLHRNTDGHKNTNKAMFTCMPTTDILKPDGSLKPASQHLPADGSERAAGPSFDQVIANHIGNATPHKAIYLWVDTSMPPAQPLSQHFYAGANDPVSGVWDPVEAINLLFSNLPDGGGGGGASTTIQRLQMQRKSVLDTMINELARIKVQLGSEDRQRLELHEQKVRDLERRLRNVINPGAGCQVPIFNPPPGYHAGSHTFANESFDIMSDIIAMAFECDITRVAALDFTEWDGPTFPFLNDVDVPGRFTDWHQMIHDTPLPTTRNPNALSDDQRTIYRVFNWYSEKIGQLLQRLDSYSTDNGTLLDSSLVVWTSDFNSGATHDTRNLPFVLAGGLNGKVATNRFIRYPDRTPCNDLLTTIMNLYGVDIDRFGWPAYANGPLSGISI